MKIELFYFSAVCTSARTNNISIITNNKFGCGSFFPFAWFKAHTCRPFSNILFSSSWFLVNRGDQEYLFADGAGIRTGDYFQFYHSDPTTALSSCNEVSKNFRKLKLDWSSRNCLQAGVSDNVCSKELVGGFVFSCCGRGESFFERCNVDSSPFLDNFPGVPMAGVFCRGEIGRGFSVLNADEGPEERTLHCCLHEYSTAYLLVSYTPARPEH